jgi:hypothetical protein
MEKIQILDNANSAHGSLVLVETINELVDAHNKTVEAIQYLARRLNTGTDKGTLEEDINSILNS